MSPNWKWYTIRILLICLSLLILQNAAPSFLNMYDRLNTFNASVRSWSPLRFGYYVNLGFSRFSLVEAKKQEKDIKIQYELTAVLLHWQRLHGLRNTFQHLLSTEFFIEIIVWNNNPRINLTRRHLTNSNRSAQAIRIINSDENLKDEAKYRACALARTRACLYVDDDWNTARYLKSLIASFRSDPTVLHAVTDSYTYYTNLVWSYFDKAIDLHTGFSWIGCGSIFLREHAQQHLQRLHAVLGENRTLFQFADVFFSIWLNDVPTQFHTDILHQPSNEPGGSFPFSSSAQFGQNQYTSSVLAIRVLDQYLRFPSSTGSQAIFSRQRKRRFPLYTQTPGFKDDLILYSNVLPFDLQRVPFNLSRDFERGTRQNLPRGADVEYFAQYSLSKAVDGNLGTCWQTHRAMEAGDFFAIDFLCIQTGVRFTLTIAHTPSQQAQLEMGVSLDGLWWIPYRSYSGRSMKKNETLTQNVHTYLFDAARFTSGFRSFRYLRFQASQKSDHRFHVCDVQLVPSTERIEEMLRDFVPVN